jgi:hypothetical protein
MTIDELIFELNRIKTKRGGQVEVYYQSSENGESLYLSDVNYRTGSMTDPEGVLLS